ncbi:uncharacterized protein LOC110732078 [Chenopodium quinoa]|uniref:uncharacterized protein LOC110732078 n=1 Tax=Chenopodium quinoa TaxID=63459 RepID=UPI000B792315|nr:uncharacterized protein LOC110732078 [Chenopodium quinoa]
MLHGSMYEHYNKIGGYIAALKRSSPGSTIELVTDISTHQNPPVFKRLFICFEALQKGWKEGCRKVLCVDGCFLKTFLGGQLLSVVGRDGNDQIFPLAWAVVEGENNLSWEWFFVQLQMCLYLGEGDGICIISNEHQHKAHRGEEMKLQFWKIAKSYNKADYTDAMDELNTMNPDAATAFKGYKPECFCRAFLDPSFRTDAITSNMVETFNGYIINARTKHILYMLEDIRANLMQRLMLKRLDMQKCTSTLCPKIQMKLETEKEKAANCDVTPSTETLFNVNYCLDQLVVNLEARTCTCRKWDMLGIPCCHAVACIFFLHKEAEDFVHES